MVFKHCVMTSSLTIFMLIYFAQTASAMYDPMLGRFASRDPIGFEGQSDLLLEFLNSSPLNGLDPTGNIPITCECGCQGGRSIGHHFEDRTVDCAGVAATCCSKICDTRYFNGRCKFTGKWKIVPGEDAYDEAEDEFLLRSCEAALCCIPIPGGTLIGGASKACWRASIVFSRKGHAMVKIISPSGKIIWRHMPGGKRIGKRICGRATEPYVEDIRWWSVLFPEIPLLNPLGTTATKCSPNCVWTATRAIWNGLW